MKNQYGTNGILSSVNVTDDREACEKYWIAVLVQMNCEKKVSQKMINLGYECYVPTQIEIRQWSDRKKKVEKVVIPMILFLHIDSKAEKQIQTYSFIKKVLSFPGENVAAIIPDTQISDLKFMLSNSELPVEIINGHFEIGEEVEIVRGPLKGLSGKLCNITDKKQMVGVHLELLGYACANVSKADIKKINK